MHSFPTEMPLFGSSKKNPNEIAKNTRDALLILERDESGKKSEKVRFLTLFCRDLGCGFFTCSAMHIKIYSIAMPFWKKIIGDKIRNTKTMSNLCFSDATLYFKRQLKILQNNSIR